MDPAIHAMAFRRRAFTHADGAIVNRTPIAQLTPEPVVPTSQLTSATAAMTTQVIKSLHGARYPGRNVPSMPTCDSTTATDLRPASHAGRTAGLFADGGFAGYPAVTARRRVVAAARGRSGPGSSAVPRPGKRGEKVHVKEGDKIPKRLNAHTTFDARRKEAGTGGNRGRRSAGSGRLATCEATPRSRRPRAWQRGDVVGRWDA
jgi:hypothetical protein